jgi:hypothetical protein
MRLFTVEQANATLPLVRKIVEDVQQHHSRWREKMIALEYATSGARAGEENLSAQLLERDVQSLARDIAGFQRELDQLGIQLKDPRLGLCDFPSEMNGRTVLLCWHLGEPEVQFWHEVDTGFAGRQPLSPSLVG